jgi:hypothetical protein
LYTCRQNGLRPIPKNAAGIQKMLRPSKNKMFGNTERSLKDRDRSAGFVIALLATLAQATHPYLIGTWQAMVDF